VEEFKISVKKHGTGKAQQLWWHRESQIGCYRNKVCWTPTHITSTQRVEPRYIATLCSPQFVVVNRNMY